MEEWARKAGSLLGKLSVEESAVGKEEGSYLVPGTFGGWWKTGDGRKEVAVKETEKVASLGEWRVEGLVGACLGESDYIQVLLGYVKKTGLLVMEPWGKGPADAYLQKRKEGGHLVKTPALLRLLEDSAEALAHLEKKGIIHGSLAAAKLLIYRRESGELHGKVWDLSSARPSCAPVRKWSEKQMEEWRKELFEETAWRWLAPEVLKTRVRTSAADVWSWAMVAYEILSHGGVPYGAVVETAEEWLKSLEKGERVPEPEESGPAGLWTLVGTCTDIDPSKRPTPAKLLASVKELMKSIPAASPASKSTDHDDRSDSEEFENTNLPVGTKSCSSIPNS